MIAVQLPDGASLERTQAALDAATKIALATPGVEQVIEIAGISVLDNSATLANAGVGYVILKDWGVRGQGDRPGSALDRDAPAGSAGPAAGRRRASCWCRRRSRASAMPAASPWWSNCATAASTIGKLLNITEPMVEEGNSQSGLQHLVTTFRADVPQLQAAGRPHQGGDLAGFRSATCSTP